MSTIAADKLRAQAAGVETPMVYPVRGSAKAWARYSGISNVIFASLNISSLSDNGLGDHTVFTSTTFISDNAAAWASSMSGYNDSGQNGNTAEVFDSRLAHGRVRTVQYNGSAMVDSGGVIASALGQLA